MAGIQFKGKVREMRCADNSLAYRYVAIPELGRQHCDMAAFRSHPKYRDYANSDLFHGILARIKAKVFGPSNRLKLNAIPDGVDVDESGFLAVVTLDV